MVDSHHHKQAVFWGSRGHSLPEAGMTELETPHEVCAVKDSCTWRAGALNPVHSFCLFSVISADKLSLVWVTSVWGSGDHSGVWNTTSALMYAMGVAVCDMIVLVFSLSLQHSHSIQIQQ